jgi:hypothetical protein
MGYLHVLNALIYLFFQGNGSNMILGVAILVPFIYMNIYAFSSSKPDCGELSIFIWYYVIVTYALILLTCCIGCLAMCCLGVISAAEQPSQRGYNPVWWFL